MASVRTEITIEAGADDVWEVIRDFDKGPVRMAPGHVVDSVTEDGVRVVTFANGSVARERFIAVDDEQRRIVFSIIGGTVVPEHDNASMQVLEDGDGRSRFVWIHDVLPMPSPPRCTPRWSKETLPFNVH
jgi:hypothetical protein